VTSPPKAGEVYALLVHPAAILAFDPGSGTIRTVATPGGSPDGIQVDPTADAIYWTNMGAFPAKGEGFLADDGTIERCDLDGSHRSVLVGGGAIVTPKQLQLDAENRLLYWCDREGMGIFRCRTDGSELTALLRTGRFPDDMPDVMRHCVGVAIDKRHRHLYWTQKGPPDGGLGRIFRMGLDMPARMNSASRDDVVLLLDHLPEPIDLEIDHERGQLYWTDRGDPSVRGNSINRADMTAEGLAHHEVLAAGLKEGIGLALDPAGRRAFVGDLSGAVRVLPMEGGPMSILHQFDGPVTGLCFGPTRRQVRIQK
jgi:hypothetical protein